MAATPFDWKSLITPAVTLGMKAVGDAVAPSPELQNSQTQRQQLQLQQQQNAFNNQQTQFTDQLELQRRAKADQIRQATLPGMYTTLGFTPEQGRQMAARSAPTAGGVTPPAVSTSPTLPTAPPLSSSNGPGLGSTIGKVALTTGLGVAPAAIEGLIKGGGGGALGALGGAAGAATMGLAAAVPIAAYIWKKSQVHPTADKWVQGEQNPFDANWQTIEKSGLPPDQMEAAKQQSAQNYLNTLAQFSTQGTHEFQVAKQAAATFRQYYGDPMKYGIQLPF